MRPLSLLLVLLLCATGCVDEDQDGYHAGVSDCDDDDPAVHPGAPELCNGIDDDCDGDTLPDEEDEDDDGVPICLGDCDDDDPTILPGALEVCDGVDQDCDSEIDEGFDVDGDGFTSCGGDCDDDDPGVHPGATELCNAVDDDCDGDIDEGFDLDGDGFTSCGGDCDDGDAAIHPGAPEACDQVDDDCDGDLELGEACAAACGDGAIAEPPIRGPACPASAPTVVIFDAVAFADWVADPTSNADVRVPLDFGGADLTVWSECSLLVRQGADFTGIGQLLLAAGALDLRADIEADAAVLWSPDLMLRTGAAYTGEHLTAEGDNLDARGDVFADDGWCLEGDDVIVRQGVTVDLVGGDALVVAEQLDFRADVLGAADITLDAADSFILRQASVLDAGNALALSAGGFLDLHGDLPGPATVDIDAESFILRSAAAITNAASVDVTVYGAGPVNLYGDIEGCGDVTLDLPETILRGAGALRDNASVTLTVDGLLVGTGDITDNGAVAISSVEHELNQGHDFGANASCTISGVPLGLAPNGCTAVP